MSAKARIRATGVFYALGASIWWGFVPVQIHFLGDVDPFEIDEHHSRWSREMLCGLVR